MSLSLLLTDPLNVEIQTHTQTDWTPGLQILQHYRQVHHVALITERCVRKQALQTEGVN